MSVVPEPLDGKINYFAPFFKQQGYGVDNVSKDIWEKLDSPKFEAVMLDDLIRAVQWLKKKIEDGLITGDAKRQTIKIINKAFVDVTGERK